MTTLIYAMACTFVFGCGLYRLKYVDAESTRLSVRLVFWAMTVVAFVCMLAGFAWEYVADWIDVLLAASFALVQLRTATLWRTGVPEQYRKVPEGGLQ